MHCLHNLCLLATLTQPYIQLMYITPQYNICTLSYPPPTEGFGAWDNSSCRVLTETDTEVTCGCDHLTHFAILMVSGIVLTENTSCGTLIASCYC